MDDGQSSAANSLKGSSPTTSRKRNLKSAADVKSEFNDLRRGSGKEDIVIPPRSFYSWLRPVLYIVFVVLLLFHFLPQVVGNDPATDKNYAKSESPFLSKKLNRLKLNNPSDSLFVNSPPKLRKDLSTLPVVMSAEKISQKFRHVANDELGVRSMQEVFDRLKTKTISINHVEQTRELADRVDKKFEKYVGMLIKSRQAVQAHYDKKPMDIQVFRRFKECCLLDHTQLQYESQFMSGVNRSFSCDIIPPSTVSTFSHLSFYPATTLLPVYTKNSQYSEMRWQYFISPEGSHIEYPGHELDPARNISNCLGLAATRHRSQYMATTLPFTKRVVILVEYGSSLSDAQLWKIRQVSKFLLQTFSHQDMVTVMAVSGDTVSTCNEGLFNATWETKQRLGEFIQRLPKRKEPTNHSLGFEEAFKSLAAYKDLPGHSYIFYISRGVLSSLKEASQVMSTIAKLNLDTRVSVQINTFPVLDSGKVPLWETQFLQDVAKQNFNKHTQIPEDLKKSLNKLGRISPEGKMIVVNASESQTLTLERIFDILKKPEVALHREYRKQIYWSEPHPDPTAFQERHHEQNGVGWRVSQSILSMGVPVWHGERMGGMVGQDISLGSLHTLLHFHSFPHPSTYAFLIHPNGETIVHPWGMWGKPWVVEMGEVEEWAKGEETLLSSIKGRATEGSLTVQARHFNTTVPLFYTWKKLENAPYVLVVAVKGGKPEPDTISVLDGVKFTSKDLTYHRLDLQLNSARTKNRCLNLGQLSTLDQGTVYIGPGCFRNPFQRLMARKETKSMAAGYWAHLVDSIHLISNTGIKTGVKEELAALAKIIPVWKKGLKESSLSPYILRRFVSSPQGVLVSYPGGLHNSHYDPTGRDWYRRALEYPGQVVITAPYLDPAGAGYVVTISHTVYEGKPAALHHEGDRVTAVMGLDVSPRFLYKMILEVMPSCTQPGIRCILIDDRGYLIASEARHLAVRQPPEKHHFVHQEPLLAGDLLEKPQLVRKILCRRFSDRSIQRLYRFNTNFRDVIKETEEGMGCTKFQLVHVSRTNTFLVQLNSTCSQIGSAFCPCSVTDRRCLNCRRSEPRECECPCECPMPEESCPAVPTAFQLAFKLKANGNGQNKLGKALERKQLEKALSIPNCDLPETGFNLPQLSPALLHSLARIDRESTLKDGGSNSASGTEGNLPQCLQVNCNRHSLSEMTCLGLIGCQWCFKQDNGRDLEKPFCSSLDSCFDGVKGRSPHGQRRYAEEPITISTPVGPVAGAIMGVFVLTVIGVYCYRYQISRLVENRGSQSGSGARLHMAVEEEQEEYAFDLAGSKPSGNGPSASNSQTQGVNHLLLASFERDGPLPPPHWRHGPRTESSDHGYSTMTGNCDDSEQATTIEPLTPTKGKIAPGTSRKRNSAIGMVPNQSETVGSTAKLLVLDEITGLNSNSLDSSKRNSRTSPEPHNLSSQTVLPDDAHSFDTSADSRDSNRTLTIAAEIHAIDAQ